MTKQEAESRIEEIILELKITKNYNIKFIKFSSNNYNVNSAKIVLEDINYNEVGEITFASFCKSREWVCKGRIKDIRSRRIENKILTDEKDILSRINDILILINKNKDFNIKFKGFVGKYTGLCSTKIILIDLDYNVEESIWLYGFLRNKRWICKPRKNSKIKKTLTILDENIASKNILEKVKYINKTFNLNIEFRGFLNPWNGVKTKLILFCNIHKTTSYPTYNSFMKKNKNVYGCTKCSNIIHGLISRLDSRDALKNIKEKFKNDSTNYNYDNIKEDFKTTRSIVKIICPTHGEFKQSYISLLTRDPGTVSCPECRRILFNSNSISKPEEKCGNIIKSITSETVEIHNIIKDIDKYRIKYPTSRSYLEPDFYIPSLNIIIEYNGKQHYEFTSYFHKSFSDFIDQVNRDLLLREYCKDNGIRLLEIPYLDDGRLNEVIEDFILRDIDSTTSCYPKLPIIKI